MLDLGCGNGKYIPLLAPASAHYIGIDKSPKQIELADDKARLYYNTQLIVGEANKIPLPTSSIDTVIATWLIETIRDPNLQAQTLSEME